MTRYQKIKEMNVDELVEAIESITVDCNGFDCASCPLFDKTTKDKCCCGDRLYNHLLKESDAND